MMTSVQCKMARAALGWSAAELARRASVGVATVNRFEAAQGEATATTVHAMQRAFEAVGIIVEDDADGQVGIKMRRMREGDLVQLRRPPHQRHSQDDKIGKVVQVEPHPPPAGQTYRVWVEFPNGDQLPGIFSSELELVKAAPEWFASDLTEFTVLRDENDLDGVVVHCFDDQRLVIALVTRECLEDYFFPPGVRISPRPKIAEWSAVIELNLEAFKQIVGSKYATGKFSMLRRYGSTLPFVEITDDDLPTGSERLRLPNAQFSWQQV